MTTDDSGDRVDVEARVIHDFLGRLLADRSRGATLTLAEYQALYPGHETRVAAEHRALFEDSDTDEPTRVRHYRIVSRIGSGGQGVVYEAEDERLGRRVALKILRGFLDEADPRLRRFLREARTASRLDHPGVCAVYDSGSDGALAFLVMRLVEGECLAASLANRAAPPRNRGEIDAVLRYFEKAARALHAAHAAGVLHRDVKPGNLMIDQNGDPVILDFGLARAVEEEQSVLTRSGDRFGTPAYMSPEQIENPAAVGRSTDVYALGVTLYESLTRERPFDAPSAQGLYRAILESEPIDARSLNRAVSRDLSVCVSTAIERDTGRRYGSAEAFADDLRRIIDGRPIVARPVTPWRRFSRWSARNPVLSSAIAALFAVVTTALVVTSRLLSESNALNQELSDNLTNIQAGKESLRGQRIDALLRRGFQVGFSVDYEPGKACFRQALALDPANRDALAGAFLLEMPDARAALAVLDELGGAAGDDPDVLAMRAVALATAGDTDASAAASARAVETGSALRAFLAGHRAVRNFMPPVDPDAARRAMTWFRTAIRRAATPRFHHWHSLMMAACHANDREALEEAEDALFHHWPDDPATHEALAQFWFPFDEERAVRAMRRILELGPSASAHLGLAHWHLQHARVDEALAEFAEAERVAPDLPAVHLTKAMGLARLGRHEEAIGAARRAVELKDTPEHRAMLDGLRRAAAPARRDP